MQENNFTQYKKFSRFLKNNKCFYSFMKYLYVFRNNELKLVNYSWIMLYRKHSLKPKQFLVRAFMWDRTRETKTFWAKMHEQWIKYC